MIVVRPTKPQTSSVTELGSGLHWIVLAIIGCGAFFWDGLASLIDAWSRPEYSHGPLIPIIAAYLFLRELQNQPERRTTSSRMPGLALTLLGILAGLVGNLTQIPDLILYGFIAAIGGLTLIVLGLQRGLHFWPAWVYLFFMLPLPNILYWQLSVNLQFVSSRLGVDFIQALGIPVFLDGNIIDLGIYRLQVAEACSGLRYLFPLTSFSFLFAVLYRGPWWQKLMLVLSSLPITIIMNSLRIGIIGVLVNSYGTAQAEGFLHWFEGWIIFLACIVVLYLEAILLRFTTTKSESVFGILDLDMSGILSPLRSVSMFPINGLLKTVVLLLLASGALWQLLPTQRPQALNRETLAVFPMELDDWKGAREGRLDPIVENVLAADEYLLANYVSTADKGSVNLFITFYNKTTGASGIHSPEVCIPGGGWEISRWQRTDISTGNGQRPVFTVNRAVIRKGDQTQLVYYWFEQRGRRLTSEYSAKFYSIWDSITRSRTDGALVRLVTPLRHGELESAADNRLSAFVDSLTKLLPQFVPE